MNIFEDDLGVVSDALSDDFLELKSSNILLTGGTGFVGTWLVHSYLKLCVRLNLKSKMFLVSRDPEAFLAKYPLFRKSPHLVFIEGDVRSFLFPAESIDYVIHAATDVIKADQNPSDILSVNYEGTKRVLDLCAQKKIKKYLFISSGAVYGRQPSELKQISEDYVGAPEVSLASSAYGEGKRISEWLSCQAGRDYQFEVKRARCFAFIGPGLPLYAQFAVGNFIDDILHDRKIEIKGDGSAVRSYLYAADMTIWLWKILFHGKNSEAYNVGSNEEVNIAELARKCVAAAKKSLPIVIGKKADRSGPPERYVPSVRKSHDLGLQVSMDLNQAIQRSLDFFMSQSSKS